MPLAEERLAIGTARKGVAVAGEAKAHSAVAGRLDAILLASTKLAGLLDHWTALAAHGTIVAASLRKAGEPSTLASDLDHHVKVHVGLLVAPMRTERVAHLDTGLGTVNHGERVGVDEATATQVLVVDAHLAALAVDVGDLVDGIVGHERTVAQSAVDTDWHVAGDEHTLLELIHCGSSVEC